LDSRSRFGSQWTWTALLFASIGLLVSAAPASAFDVPTFSVTPSTTQAGGHPDLTVQIDRTGADNEDVRDLYLDLPPGLIGNTTTVGSCTDAQFNSDTCPANSAVGSVSAVAVAVGLSLPPTTGTIYNLVPGPTEPGAIGIVLRPTGAPLAISPVFIRGSIEVAPNGPDDVNLRNVVLNQPRQIFLLGIIPVDITVNSLTLTLNGAGTLGPGTYFLTNPTSCATATSKARVVSYLDQEVTKESSYTPTNCEAVPFDPFFAVDFNPTTIGANTAPTTTAGVPADQDPLSQSHIKETNILFPYGQVFLDFVLAGGIPACSDADLNADTCPGGTDIGTLSATVPVIDPPDFTGTLYRTNHPEIGFFTVAAVLNGPRGVRAVVHGKSAFVPGGTAFIFPAQPQVPLTALEVELTRKIYLNLSTCGPKTISAHFVGHSGATADVSDTYKTTGFNCEYARPKSSTPQVVALVPAFKACTSSNSTHAAPRTAASCNPPVPTSSYLTVGTPDANDNAANFTGDISTKVVGESPIDPNNGDQADVEITANLTDVRNAGDLTDYTGELRAVVPLRVTDRYNGASLTESSTLTETPLAFNIGCAATEGSEGGACNVATTADAVMTDLVREGKRAIWRIGQPQVFDGGADGDADTTGDNTLFAVQGTFTP
jgi:hypothetical protein